MSNGNQLSPNVIIQSVNGICINKTVANPESRLHRFLNVTNDLQKQIQIFDNAELQSEYPYIECLLYTVFRNRFTALQKCCDCLWIVFQDKVTIVRSNRDMLAVLSPINLIETDV